MENWAMKPICDDLQDMDWLISKVREQEQEIERWINRTHLTTRLAKHYKTALADVKKAHAAYRVEAEKQIDEQQDELSACKERVGELEEKLQIARNGHANAIEESIMAGEAQEQREEVGG